MTLVSRLRTGFELNDAVMSSGSLVGCRLDSIVNQPIQGVGYVEKRARGDGYDSVDVYLGSARLRLSGMIFGSNRGDTYDRLADLRAAFTPTLAYDDDSENSGYIPLYYTRPTNRTSDYETGKIDLFINVRPLTVPQIVITSDNSGGYKDTEGFAISWVVDVEAKDPRSYSVIEKTIDLSTEFMGEGTFNNIGNYPAPIEFRLYADANSPAIFYFQCDGSNIAIEVPFLDGDPCSVTLDPWKNVVILSYSINELLRMDLFTSNGEKPFPQAQANGGGYFSWINASQVINGPLFLENSVIAYRDTYI